MKKITFLLSLFTCLLFTNQVFSQVADNTIDDTGDIAFVSYYQGTGANNRGFSFVFFR